MSFSEIPQETNIFNCLSLHSLKQPKFLQKLNDAQSQKCNYELKSISNSITIQFSSTIQKPAMNQILEQKSKKKETKVIKCSVEAFIEQEIAMLQAKVMQKDIKSMKDFQFNSIDQILKSSDTQFSASQYEQQTQIDLKDGSKFLGQLQNGYMKKGQLRFRDIFVYKGEFGYGKFHGKGQIIFKSGHILLSNWKLGINEGKARLKYPLNQVYYGQIFNFKRHGQGLLFFENGSYYRGQFNMGELTGKGSYHSINGQAIFGNWQRGILLENKKSEFSKISSKSRKKREVNHMTVIFQSFAMAEAEFDLNEGIFRK